MTETLKPCPNPWCRHPGKARLEQSWGPSGWIECPCGIEGPIKATEAEAIAAWNQRPTPKAVEGLSHKEIEDRRWMYRGLLLLSPNTEEAIKEIPVLDKIIDAALSTLDAEEANKKEKV